MIMMFQMLCTRTNIADNDVRTAKNQHIFFYKYLALFILFHLTQSF